MGGLGEARDLRLPPAQEVENGYFWSLAFDPGVTTGWAVFRCPRDLLIRQGFVEAIRPGCGGGWNAGEFTGDEEWQTDTMLEIARAVYEQVDEESGDRWAISVEGFRVRMISMKRSFLSPVRLAAKFQRDMRQAPVLIEEPLSSDAMNIVTDGRLRDWNLYRPGSEHVRDAMRHAIMMQRRYSSEMVYRKLVLEKMMGLRMPMSDASQA
jgi:hypothetical protein